MKQQKKQSGWTKLLPTTNDGGIEILTDDETGEHYSYNSKTEESTWLNE